MNKQYFCDANPGNPKYHARNYRTPLINYLCRLKETLSVPHVEGIDPTQYLYMKQVSHHRESQ